MLKNFGKLRKNEKKNWGGRRLRNQKKKNEVEKFSKINEKPNKIHVYFHRI